MCPVDEVISKHGKKIFNHVIDLRAKRYIKKAGYNKKSGEDVGRDRRPSLLLCNVSRGFN